MVYETSTFKMIHTFFGRRLTLAPQVTLTMSYVTLIHAGRDRRIPASGAKTPGHTMIYDDLRHHESSPFAADSLW
jgi:hypothetical protein